MSELPSATLDMPTQKLVPICSEFVKKDAKRVSKEFVFDVYDKIAPHFSHTRYVPLNVENICIQV